MRSTREVNGYLVVLDDDGLPPLFADEATALACFQELHDAGELAPGAYLMLFDDDGLPVTWTEPDPEEFWPSGLRRSFMEIDETAADMRAFGDDVARGWLEARLAAEEALADADPAYEALERRATQIERRFEHAVAKLLLAGLKVPTNAARNGARRRRRRPRARRSRARSPG